MIQLQNVKFSIYLLLYALCTPKHTHGVLVLTTAELLPNNIRRPVHIPDQDCKLTLSSVLPGTLHYWVCCSLALQINLGLLLERNSTVRAQGEREYRAEEITRERFGRHPTLELRTMQTHILDRAC